MFRVILGVLLLFLGLITLINSGELGFIYTGGIIGGILLIVSGMKEINRKSQFKSEINKIHNNWDDILARLQKGQSIDNIAKDYYETFQVSPVRTILLTAYIIKKIAESGDQDALGAAQYLTSKQVADSNVSPEAAIDNFNFIDQVYFVEDNIFLQQIILQNKEAKPTSVSGTLILSKGYLYFFAKQLGVGDVAEIVDKARDLIPIVGVLSDGFSLVSGLSKELEDYFSLDKKSELRRRFAGKNSFAISLVRIKKLGAINDKAKMFALNRLCIVADDFRTDEERSYLLASTSGGADWVPKWIERLQLACIAEGQLMVSLKDPSLAPKM